MYQISEIENPLPPTYDFRQINEIDKSLDNRKDGCFPFWKYSVSVRLPKNKAMAFKHLGQDEYTT